MTAPAFDEWDDELPYVGPSECHTCDIAEANYENACRAFIRIQDDPKTSDDERRRAARWQLQCFDEWQRSDAAHDRGAHLNVTVEP